MKYLLSLLLLPLFCYAQQLPDDVKVTAYKLILADDDGDNCVASYVKEKRGDTYVTGDSDSKDFIQKLLLFKKENEHKGGLPFPCFNGLWHCDYIRIMIVVSGKSIADTIYTDDMQKLYFANTHKGYLDKDRVLSKLLEGSIKDFFEFDFNKHLRAMLAGKRDSITQGAISIFEDKTTPKDLLRNFKEAPQSFTFISKGSSYNEVYYLYKSGKDTLTMSKSSISIDVKSSKLLLCVAGVKLGDSEDTLKRKFPLSTAVFYFYNIRFEDIKRQYYYEVKLEGKKGRVQFYIKDKIIERIIAYYYE